MTNLADLVEGLKRQVAVPGEYATYFPNTTDPDLIGSLADGFAQAQLDGFFGDQAIDTTANTVSPDLSAAGAALVILYTQERILMSKLRNLNSKTTYKAGSVEYTVEQPASVLTSEIKALQERRKELLAQALRVARGKTGTYMVDAYMTRAVGLYPFLGLGEWGGWYSYELVGLCG